MPNPAPHRILIIDDEDVIRSLLEKFCRQLGYEAVVAPSGEAGIELLDPSLDLVLLDFDMPGLNGLEVLEHIRHTEPYSDLPVIMVTGNGARALRIRALEAGVNDYLTKPFDLSELKARTATMLQARRTQLKVIHQRNRLEQIVAERTVELRESLANTERTRAFLEESYRDSLHRLSIAAEYKDELTANHVTRVGHFAALIGRKIGLAEPDVHILSEASRLHDVGKIGVPDAVLLKPGRFTPQERQIMERHCDIGARILSDSPSPILHAARVVAKTHHEWWDGSGYPDGLTGEEIPLYGRICAVADVFDALTSRRPYKEPMSNARSYGILAEGRGRQFDPVLVDTFLACEPDIESIQNHFVTDPDQTSPLRARNLQQGVAEGEDGNQSSSDRHLSGV